MFFFKCFIALAFYLSKKLLNNRPFNSNVNKISSIK